MAKVNWVKCAERLPERPTEKQLHDGKWPRYWAYVKLGWTVDYSYEMLAVNWDGKRFGRKGIGLDPITEDRPLTENKPFGVSHWAELPDPPETD